MSEAYTQLEFVFNQLEFVFNPLERQPLHKWFSAETEDAESWLGPFDTVEKAAKACVDEMLPAFTGQFIGCFVAQGFRVKKADRTVVDVDYEVRCDCPFRVSVRASLVRDSKVEKEVEIRTPGQNVPVSALAA